MCLEEFETIGWEELKTINGFLTRILKVAEGKQS